MAWRNRIGEETIERDANGLDSWDEVIHKRVSPFVKLYSEVTNFATFMVIAHRNLLSLYHLGSNERTWVDTVKLMPDSEDHIRKMQIKKRPKNDRNVSEVKTFGWFGGNSKTLKKEKKSSTKVY